VIPQDRDLRCAALAAAASTCGVSSPGKVVDTAKVFYEWLTESTPLPPPAFGFVEAAAQSTQSATVPEYLSIDEACEMMGLSEPTMRRNAATNPDFPQKVKISKRRVAYRRTDIENYLTNQ